MAAIELIEMVKPNGTVVKVNENSLAHAKSLGWKEKEAKPSTPAK